MNRLLMANGRFSYLYVMISLKLSHVYSFVFSVFYVLVESIFDLISQQNLNFTRHWLPMLQFIWNSSDSVSMGWLQMLSNDINR